MGRRSLRHTVVLLPAKCPNGFCTIRYIYIDTYIPFYFSMSAVLLLRLSACVYGQPGFEKVFQTQAQQSNKIAR